MFGEDSISVDSAAGDDGGGAEGDAPCGYGIGFTPDGYVVIGVAGSG